MKELETKEKDKIEQVKQTVQEIQTVYLGKHKPQKNHTLFEINTIDRTIVKAEFDTLPAIDYKAAMDKQISSFKKITVKANCIYISALNVKNVIKILNREYGIKLE